MTDPTGTAGDPSPGRSSEDSDDAELTRTVPGAPDTQDGIVQDQVESDAGHSVTSDAAGMAGGSSGGSGGGSTMPGHPDSAR